MLRLLKTLCSGYKNLLNRYGNGATDAWEERDWTQFLKNLGLMLLMMFIPAVGIAFLLLAIYKWWKLVLALATPPLIVAVLIASYFENHKVAPSTLPPPPVLSIDVVQANARRTYRPMTQCMFLLFTELCRYLPGLVQPFSLAAVEAPVHFDITAGMIVTFHYIIGKGDNGVPVSVIAEILSSIITQHLQAQDLPISIPAIYTSADGSTWTGLVVDGVYDLGHTYRVDLVITNEAMVSRLKARAASGPDGYNLDSRTVHDPDFD